MDNSVVLVSPDQSTMHDSTLGSTNLWGHMFSHSLTPSISTRVHCPAQIGQRTSQSCFAGTFFTGSEFMCRRAASWWRCRRPRLGYQMRSCAFHLVMATMAVMPGTLQPHSSHSTRSSPRGTTASRAGEPHSGQGFRGSSKRPWVSSIVSSFPGSCQLVVSTCPSTSPMGTGRQGPRR